MKDFFMFVVVFVWEIIHVIVKNMLKGILRFDRYVLKRYFNIETPVYKYWWKCNVKYVQRKINNQVK